MSDINSNKKQYQSEDYDAITRWSKSFVFYPEEIIAHLNPVGLLSFNKAEFNTALMEYFINTYADTPYKTIRFLKAHELKGYSFKPQALVKHMQRLHTTAALDRYVNAIFKYVELIKSMSSVKKLTNGQELITFSEYNVQQLSYYLHLPPSRDLARDILKMIIDSPNEFKAWSRRHFIPLQIYSINNIRSILKTTSMRLEQLQPKGTFAKYDIYREWVAKILDRQPTLARAVLHQGVSVFLKTKDSENNRNKAPYLAQISLTTEQLDLTQEYYTKNYNPFEPIIESIGKPINFDTIGSKLPQLWLEDTFKPPIVWPHQLWSDTLFKAIIKPYAKNIPYPRQIDFLDALNTTYNKMDPDIDCIALPRKIQVSLQTRLPYKTNDEYIETMYHYYTKGGWVMLPSETRCKIIDILSDKQKILLECPEDQDYPLDLDDFPHFADSQVIYPRNYYDIPPHHAAVGLVSNNMGAICLPAEARDIIATYIKAGIMKQCSTLILQPLNKIPPFSLPIEGEPNYDSFDPTKGLATNSSSIYANSESFFATQVLLFALILSYKQNSIKKALPALLIAGAMSYIENINLAPEDADFSFSFFKYGMCALMGALYI